MASKKKLTEKEKQFVHYYILKGNAGKAAKMAGYSPASCYVLGHRLLKKVNVCEYKDRLLAEMEHDQAQMRWETIATARACANSDIYDVATWNPSGVEFRAPEDMDPMDRRIVRKLNTKVDNSGVHQTFEIEGKHQYMDYLAKVYGWYKDPRLEISGDLGPVLTICDIDGKPEKQISLGKRGESNDPDRDETSDE